MSGARRDDYFHGVDAVRFIAALMVAVFHIGLACWAAPATTTAARLLNRAYELPALTAWIWFGWVGVQIFFVVSGFVIATAAEGVSPLAFLKSRIVRLYPVAWLASTLVLIVLAVNGLPPSPRAYAASMLLLPTGPWIDGQYWTLGQEIMFYGLIFLLLAARRFGWIGNLATALGLASAAYILVLTLYPGIGFLRTGFWRLTLLYFGIYFAIGIFVRLWMTGRLTTAMGASWAVCLLAAILQTRLHALSMASALPDAGMNLADYWYVPTLIFFAGTLAIMASARWHEAVSRLPGAVLKALRAAGLATYPLYLIHFSIGVALARTFVLWGMAPAAALVVTVATLVITSMFIALIVEPAVRRRLRALLNAAELRFISPVGSLNFLQRT